MDQGVDLLVVGGGVNGAAVARDAAGRGLSVVLCERGDLAGATSSASSKLVHGGLRYLETYEFRLVRESLMEREVLLRSAPHIVRPLRFVLPLHAGMRPAWMLRAGLFLYDHLAGRKILPPARSLRRGRDSALDPLKPSYRRAFEYSDCAVDDARMVVLNARDAADRGAEVLTRTEFSGAERQDGGWLATLKATGGATRQVRARALVNAAGPWVGEALHEIKAGKARHVPRLVKGSHIVTRRLHDLPQAYTFQEKDGRVVFAIPYEDDFTLIGTTDVPFEGDASHIRASQDEVDYLRQAASEYFARPVEAADVVWTYSGVRPLYDDGAAKASTITRDYAFDLDTGEGRAPLLSIFGGKLTTHRVLAEHAMRELKPLLGVTAGPWTEHAHLPGGDFDPTQVDAFIAGQQRRWPALPAGMIRRMCRAYGTRIEAILGQGDTGELIGGRIAEAELAYLKQVEWARTAEDVLWRRSKLGLHLDAAGQARVKAWFGS
jgi:glycerol-3-phosphate dehydrogenase